MKAFETRLDGWLTFVLDVGDMSNYSVEFFRNDVNSTDLVKYHIRHFKLELIGPNYNYRRQT